MSSIRFHVTKEGIQNLTVEEFEAIEMATDGDLKVYRVRPALARFVVDENGEPVPHQVAMQRLGQLSLRDMENVIREFGEAIRMAAVPKESGS